MTDPDMETGTVVFWHGDETGDGGYGFISPDDNLQKVRENNLWFGRRAAGMQKFRRGARVEFGEGKFKAGYGRQAAFVQLLDDDDREEITTLEGIDDVT